jgi:pimeloyl-ACP methyl ester carboxylesterase
VTDLPDVEGVSHRTVSARGVDFHVAEAGAGDPIVLVHGWPQHWWSWRRVVPLLAPRARLVMPDLRGLGWSSVPPGGYDKRTLADDLIAILDELGLERVRLVGHDWGTWIGFLAGLAAPERFTAFLALSCPPPMGRPNPHQALESWRFAYQFVLAAPAVGERLIASGPFIERLIRGGTADRGLWTDADLRVYSEVLAEPLRAHASVQLYRTFLLREVWRTYAGHLRVPTRLLTGDKDAVIAPVFLEGAERYGDDLAVETIPGCGHFVPEERPELVAERAGALFGLPASA